MGTKNTNILFLVLSITLLQACAKSLSDLTDVAPSSLTGISESLKTPECGETLRTLINTNFNGESGSDDLLKTLDSDSGLMLSSLNLTPTQAACISKLKSGDFVAGFDSYQLMANDQQSCQMGSLQVSSVESFLRYDANCIANDSTYSNSKIKVSSSVGSFLKFKDATQDTSTSHLVLSSVDTHLKYAEAMAVSGVDLNELYNKISTILSSGDTFLNFTTLYSIYITYADQMKRVSSTHIQDNAQLSFLNSVFTSDGSKPKAFTLNANSILIDSVGDKNLSFCSGANFDDSVIDTKGIIQLGQSFWSAGSNNLMNQLGFAHTAEPICGGLATPTYSDSRSIYAEDYLSLLDKGMVKIGSFPISLLNDLGTGGNRVLDQGLVIGDQLTSDDLNYLKGYFWSRIKTTINTCNATDVNGDCTDLQTDIVPVEDQLGRLIDQGIAVTNFASATQMANVLIKGQKDYPEMMNQGDPNISDKMDQLLKAGIVGTDKSALLGYMFNDQENFGDQFFAYILDSGIYFDGIAFRTINSHLKVKNTAKVLAK